MLSTFIDVERARLHQQGPEAWRNEPNWKKRWLTNMEQIAIADRYKIPIAFMFRGAHAIVLTKPLAKNPNGSYNILYYDPFRDGEQMMTITPSRDILEDIIYVSKALSENISPGNILYDQIGQAVRDIKYDLSIPTIPGKEWLGKAKTALTQTDGHNCTLWNVWHAAVGWSMQPGDNLFKLEGLAILTKEAGVRLITYEDVVASSIKVPNKDAGDGPAPAEDTAERENIAKRTPETPEMILAKLNSYPDQFMHNIQTDHIAPFLKYIMSDTLKSLGGAATMD